MQNTEEVKPTEETKPVDEVKPVENVQQAENVLPADDVKVQEPSLDCIEYKLNNYHLHGVANCAFCNKPKVAEVPAEIHTEAQIEKYQKEVMEKQTNVLLDIDPNDPDQLLELLERYGDCPCCRGLVFNCDGKICEELGKCYCMQKDLQDHID